MLYVALSGLVLFEIFLRRHIFTIFMTTCFYKIHLKFILSHIYFHLDDCELLKQYQFVSEEMMGADMQFRNS